MDSVTKVYQITFQHINKWYIAVNEALKLNSIVDASNWG